MANCPVLKEISECTAQTQRVFVLYQGREFSPKWVTLERKIAGWKGIDFVCTFEMCIGFDEMLYLFFTAESREHAEEQLNKLDTPENHAYLINTMKHDVICKFCTDFNSGLHSVNFIIKNHGTKLRGHVAKPVADRFPIDSTDVLIIGSFEF